MDIDTDFQNQYRHVIVEYVQAKYGYDHVSQIVTYNMLGLKSIIRNVGKVLGIPYLVTDELSKNVPKKIRKFVYLEEEDREEEQEIEPTLEDLKTIPFLKKELIPVKMLLNFSRLVNFLMVFHLQQENTPVELLLEPIHFISMLA